MLAFGPVGAGLVPHPSEVVMVRFDADVPGIDVFLDEGSPVGGDPLWGDPFTSVFGAMFVIVPVIIIGGIVLVVVLAVVNARRLQKKGINPLATEAEIVADAVRGSSAQRLAAQPAQTATQTVEARLAEIDRLHAAGTITAAERDAARAGVLRTI